MITLKTMLLLAFVIPLNANNIDDEIIKNLDFFQSMDLVKDENPFAYNKSRKENISDDQLTIQNDIILKGDDLNVEKKQ